MSWASGESVDPGPKPIWRRWRWLVAAVLGFSLSLYGAAYLLGHSAVARRLAEIRARGEPTNFDELEAYHVAPPTGRDATRLWLKGGGAIRIAAAPYENSDLPYFGNAGNTRSPSKSPKEMDLSRSFLQVISPALQDLHEAADLGGRARYPLGLGEKFDERKVAIQSLRAAARALSLETHVRAGDRDFQGAAQSVRAGLLLAESWANDPTTLGQLIHSAFYSIAIGALQDIGPVNLPREELALLQATLVQIDFSDSLKRMAIGDRVDNLSQFDHIADIGLPAHLRYVSVLSRSNDQLAMLDLAEKFIAATALPWPQAADAMDEWSEAFRRVKPWNVVTKWNISGPPMAFRTLLRDETRNRLAITDVAIARFHQERGQWPETLAALVPTFLDQLPLDPLTALPFQYKTTADRYVLYSPTNPRVSFAISTPDPETGADPLMVFRWPPLPEEPKGAEDTEASPVDAPEDSPAAAIDE